MSATASAQPGRIQGRYVSEPVTAFEAALAGRSDTLNADLLLGPAPGNARGLIFKNQTAAVLGLTVIGRKYGVQLDGTGDVLVKNFIFRRRQSNDIFGSGLILGQSHPTRGETWVSNAWIDLEGKGPIPDYKLANNEAVTVELNNAPLNIRKAVLIGGEESGLDNKSFVRIDASFIASGHRSIRAWSGSRLVIANSVILAYPGMTGLWFGGGAGEARVDYYNCLFGAVGDSMDQLHRDPPDWMIHRDADDPVAIRLRRLDRDPFDRAKTSFWKSARAPIPPGYLKSPT
jgi:hypothetical protein